MSQSFCSGIPIDFCKYFQIFLIFPISEDNFLEEEDDFEEE